MTELMPADAARRETQKIIDAKAEDILNEIAAGIQDSIQSGEFNYDVYKPLQDKVISILRENGYEIKDMSTQFDGLWIRISWK